MRPILFRERWRLEIDKSTPPVVIFRGHPMGRWTLCELRVGFTYPIDDPRAYPVDMPEEDDYIMLIALASTNKRKVCNRWRRQLSRGRRWF
jgi:hypothetical protein